MTITKQSAFTIKHWDEVQNTDWKAGKLTRTLATKEFTGQLTGTAVLEAVMLRLEGNQGAMAYVGVEHVSCTVDGRTGTFVLVHNAEALGNERSATWKILPGSGTGELAGISGYGKISPNHEFTLVYELPPDKA
nr:hypothetical protein [uncultured bacterium]